MADCFKFFLTVFVIISVCTAQRQSLNLSLAKVQIIKTHTSQSREDSKECKVARTDKSYSAPILCTYLTPNPTNRALYLS